MSQSFYNHLAQLLGDYFSNHAICKGDKYRFIIENDEGRKMFKEALKTLEFDDITIKGIFSISDLEEEYNTFYVKFPGQPRLIVGDIDSATINYLDTLRNAVSSDKPFADDAILYILKSDISSSIKSASRRLDDPGMPFDIKEIARALKNFIESNIQNNKEKAYLQDYISTKANEIESRRFTMFDFGNIIDVVYGRTFNNNSFTLGYFRDERLEQGQYSPDRDVLIERIRNNRSLYEDVERIIKEGDKEKGLEKLFNESMTALIISHENDWFSFFDYDTINEGRLSKRATNNKFVSCQVLIPSHEEDYNINPRDKKSNKKQQIIVFDDRHNVSETSVRLSFEKPLPNTRYPQNCIKSRENLTISLGNSPQKVVVDPDNTNYRFTLLRLPISKSDFTELAPFFSINNRGDIIIDLPSNISSVRLGGGTNELTIPEDGNVVWSPGGFMNVSTGQDETNEFNIDFNGLIVKFIIRGGTQATVPREPLYLIQDVYNYRDSYRRVNDNGSDSFSLLRLQEHQFSIKSIWFRQLLKGEQFMCNNHVTTSSVMINVEQEFSYDKIDIDLPKDVRDAYNNLCDYFAQNKLVPSLAYVTKELRHLYEQYIIAINTELSSIQDNGILDARHKAICRLGVVEDTENKRVFLSPLHPMLVAYQLDFSRSYDVAECPANVMALASPLFLMPYISYNDVDYRPYIDNLNDGIRTWLFFEKRNRQQQIRIDNLTTKVVLDKIIQFRTNCSYLFSDSDTPLKINAIGIDDDENIVIAIIRYIKECLNNNWPVQKIEVHLYVDDLLKENFYQKLYRLNHYDLIINEINELNENLDDSYNYTEKDLIRVLLSRVLFFTHPIDRNNENNTTIYYSHLTFYRMLNKESVQELHEVYMKDLTSEIGYNGLVSQYSTIHKENTYRMGFGIKGIENKVDSFDNGYIFRIAYLMNELYFNSLRSDVKPYHKNACLGNIYVFNVGQLLQRIYENSCWVTFISPEVDIDFFYRSGLYIIHFTDQLTLNSKYDSVTVTNRIKQYNNLLHNACSKFAENQLQPEEMSKFQQQMLHYFNVLNGRWLLELNRKTTLQVREKVSVVAACLVIREFLQKMPDTLWIPISIEEIVRVTKNIGLKEDHLFSKKELGIKGPMSDDLLIMGLNYQDPNNLKLYFYPVEVKVSDSHAVAAHGKNQIAKTYQAFKQNIFGKDNFVKCVYRTFFTNIMLLTADKMKAYNLISEDEYNKLQEYRIQLLNLNYVVQDRMPLVEFGHCALMVFHQELPMLRTIPAEDFELAICELYLPFEYALNIISGNKSQVVQTAERQPFIVDDVAKNYMESSNEENEVDISSGEASSASSQSDAVTDSSETVLHPTPASTTDPVLAPVYKPAPESEPESEPTTAPATDSVSGQPQVPISVSGSALCDEQKYEMKILIGNTLSNNKEVYYEPNNTYRLLNLNLGITGTSGSGKTQNLSAIIYQLSKIKSENVGNHPVGMLIFDYKGDYNSDDFCQNVGGTCAFGNFPFNPLHLIYSERDKQVKNIPAITAERVSDVLAKSYDSGTVQQARIKQVIIQTYEDFGITSDPDTWSLTAPTMNDVVNNYFDKYETTDTVYALFSNLKDWRIFESDPQKCVSIFDWLTCPRVIDLTSFSDEIKRAIVSLILEIFNNEMHLLGPSRYVEDKREIRAFVVVDEAHQFLSKDYDALDKILREGRSFGVGMFLATQNISDFKTKKNNYSANVSAWILHHQVNITKQELYSVFGNTDPNLNQYSAFLTKSGYNAITKFGKIVNANSCVQYRKLIDNN